MKPFTIGYLYAILASFFFALIAIIGKNLITGGIHPFQLLFFQYMITVFLLGCWLMLRQPKSLACSRKTLILFAFQGIVGGAGTSLFFYTALTSLNAGITSMLLFINPVYISVFFALTKIRRMKLINYISVLLAVSGAAVVLDVFSAGSLSLPISGVFLGMGSGICYAFYNVFADLKLKSEDPNVINFYSSSFGLLFTGILLGISGIGYSISITTLPSIFILASVSGILPIFFIFKAFQYIGSEKVSVIASVELPMTLIMAFLFLGESMKPIQLAGVVMIVASAFLLHREEG